MTPWNRGLLEQVKYIQLVEKYVVFTERLAHHCAKESQIVDPILIQLFTHNCFKPLKPQLV
jgi:hypothetical protein